MVSEDISILRAAFREYIEDCDIVFLHIFIFRLLLSAMPILVTYSLVVFQIEVKSLRRLELWLQFSISIHLSFAARSEFIMSELPLIKDTDEGLSNSKTSLHTHLDRLSFGSFAPFWSLNVCIRMFVEPFSLKKACPQTTARRGELGLRLPCPLRLCHPTIL